MPIDPKQGWVEGTVRAADGKPVANVRVVASDRDLRSEDTLGEAFTDLRGAYAIQYSFDAFAPKEKGGADLVVRAYEGAFVLAKSPTLFNADSHATIDLVVPGAKQPSEYERLAAICQPLLGDVAPHELTADDLEFLSGETSWDLALLRAFQLAHSRGRVLNVIPESLYGCGREGLPLDLDALGALAPEEVRAALKRAVARRVIPERVVDEIESLRRALAEHAVRSASSSPRNSAKSAAAVFEAVLSDSPEQEAAVRVWLDHRRTDDQLWSRLVVEGKLSEGRVQEVRTALESAKVVGAYSPLLEAVLAKTEVKSSGVEALAKNDGTDWKRLLEDAGVQPPEECPGEDESSKLASYAEGLARSVDASFPRAALRRELGRSEFGPSVELAGLLEREPTLDLARDPLDAAAGSLERHGPLEPKLKEHLFNVGRLSRVTERPFQAKALAEQGISSAHAIGDLALDVFVSRFSTQVGGAVEAARIHRRASQVNARVMGLLIRFRADLNHEIVAGAQGPRTAAPPEWRELFGEVDFCRCPECRSVLSPAAYFVDLLQFLRRRSQSTAPRFSALDALFARRPDLGHLELSCANTTTLLPTIDIIDELCENALAPAPLPTASGRPAEALALRPEFVNQGAYEVLARAPFPWTLPVDRAWEELRVHLPLLGSERWEIIEDLRAGDVAARFAAAAERLDLPVALAEAIVERAGQAESWGLGADWVTALASARTLLSRSGLSYEELEGVLGSRFVRGEQAAQLLREGDGCTLDQITVEGLSEPLLGRLQAFVRIQRHSGWSTAGLDDVLASLGVAALDRATVIALGDARWLERETGRPLSEISTWWGTLGTAPRGGGLRSVYEDIFHDPARTSALDPKLALDAGEPSGFGEPLSAHAASLRAALGASPAEFDALVAAESDRTLSVRTLSSLWRRHALAGALRLPLEELFALFRLLGSAPAAPEGPEQARKLVACARQLASWGLSATRMERLLSGASLPVTPGSDRPSLEDALSALRIGLLRPDEDSGLDRPALATRLLAQSLELDESLLGALLSRLHVSSSAGPVSLIQVLTNEQLLGDDSLSLPALRHVERCVQLVAPLHIAAEDLPLVTGAGPASWLDLDALPQAGGGGADVLPALFAGFRQSARWFLRRNQRAGGSGWAAVVRDATVGVPAPELLTRSALLLGLDAAEASELAGAGALDLRGDDWVSGEALLRLERARARLLGLGVGARVGLAWAADRVDDAAAAIAVESARARHAAITWPAVARPLRDVLRERQRDALVAALTTRDGCSKADLSDRLLMDVEIAACQTTSRIQAAIGSVQRFIDRCFQGLEAGVRFDADARAEWRWLQNYRVWELHRKVFLFPEDFLRPELRDDKSPFFVELERELLQGDVTDARAETLFGRYLERLDSVARLEVSGCYREELLGSSAVASKRFHVVARSKGEPYSYWYRTFEDAEGWTPWEKIELDVRAEQVVLTAADGRLYLCWPVFEERPYDAPPPAFPVLTTDATAPRATPPEPAKYLQVSLAYSRRSGDGWEPRKMAEGALRIDKDLSKSSRAGARPRSVPPSKEREIRLVAQTVARDSTENAADSVDLVVRCHVRTESAATGDIGLAVGEFRLGGCHGTFRGVQFGDGAGVLEGSGAADPRRPAVLTTRASRLTARGLESLAGEADTGELQAIVMDQVAPFPKLVDPAAPVAELHPTRQDVVVLDTQLPYRMVLPQNGQFFFDGPFFYEDERNTFFVRPRRATAEDTSAQATAFELLPASAVTLGIAAHAEQVLAREAERSTTSDDIAAAIPLDRAVTLISRRLSSSGPTLAVGESAIARHVGDWMRGLTSGPGGRLHFSLFSHPYVCRFLVALRTGGVEGLLTRAMQLPAARPALDFEHQYPPRQGMVVPDYPKEEVDFSPGGPYSLYNWELFVHAPFLIAKQLQANQRYEEAQRWFEFLFDPTRQSDEPAPGRYWNVQPFYEAATRTPVDELREILTRPAHDVGRTPGLYTLVQGWRRNPFSPWRVAALRKLAVPKAIVLAYLELLLDWGDSLFRQFTREALNQASLLYMLAARLLGPRPQALPSREPPPESYLSLRDRLDAFSNAILRTEALVPFDPELQPGITDPSAIRALGTTFYFCVPPNPYLFGFWDRVEDRLYKIRHCQDIEGTVRQPPLFDDPLPLDALSAAGRIPSRRQLPLCQYRFPVLLSKALELAGEVRALGGALLGAIERRDGEELSRIRSTHEQATLAKVREVRTEQIAEAEKQLASLEAGQALIRHRKRHYERLRSEDLNFHEQAHLVAMGTAGILQGFAGVLETAAAGAHAAPSGDFGVAGMGGTPTAKLKYGGENVGNATQAAARGLSVAASVAASAGGLMATMGGFERRREEWSLQVEIADRELTQIEAQIEGARKRITIAQRELELHELQTRHTEQVDEYLRSKFSNLELYSWMVSQLSTLHFAMYQLALSAAGRAEEAYAFELADGAAGFVNPGSWDSLRKGLLAGERLQLDLRRMEESYLLRNRRENELTKHISLALLDPMALFTLKTEGRCDFRLPEWLFDFDHPGHYLRRIKTLAVSLPAVVGPYTSVNARLTLTSNEVRISEGPADIPYAYQGIGDDRISSDFHPVQGTISTSRGSGDGGAFELSLRDERYAPFEGAGVTSSWSLQLDPQCNDFDPSTVSDVVLELAYTSRTGTDEFRDKCIREVLNASPREPRVFAFSAANDAPEQWHEFLHPIDPARERLDLRMSLERQRLPYRHQRSAAGIIGMRLIMWPANTVAFSALGGTAVGVSVRVFNSRGNDLADPTAALRASGSGPLTCELLFNDTQDFGEWRLSVGRRELEVAVLPALAGGVPSGGLASSSWLLAVFVTYV